MIELDDAMARVRAAYSPGSADKQRLRVAISGSVGGAVLVGATTAKGSLAGGVAGLAASGNIKLLALLAVGASLAFGAVWLSPSEPAVEASKQQVRALESVPATNPTQVVEVAAPPASANEGSAAARGAEPIDSLPPAPSESAKEAQPKPAKTSTLVAEAKLIGDASKALRGGNGALALKLLGEHGTRYPTGALAQERQGLRALSLCRTGQVEAAREAGRLYLKQSPNSPLAVHVRKGCD